MGVRAAANQRELASILREDHLLLLRTWRLPGGAPARKSMALRDEAALHAQISTLITRGVPLTEALEVAASVLSKDASRRISKVREQVAAGESFAAALRAVGGFDPVAIGVYRTAERSGNMGDAADRLAQSAARRLEVTQKIGTMMIYPAIVLVMVVGAALTMLLFVVPMVGTALEQLDVELPWYTQKLLALSLGVRGNWLTVMLVGVSLVALIMTARDAAKAFASRVINAIPAVGNLRQASEQARLFSVLAAMTRSGVPITDALAVATNALSPGALHDELATLQQDLVDGGVLRDLLERATALPLATRKLLVAADRAGDLDAAFEALAVDSAKEVDRRAERLLAIIEPALLIFLFVVVGLLAFAIMYPMMTAASSGIG